MAENRHCLAAGTRRTWSATWAIIINKELTQHGGKNTRLYSVDHRADAIEEVYILARFREVLLATTN